MRTKLHIRTIAVAASLALMLAPALMGCGSTPPAQAPGTASSPSTASSAPATSPLASNAAGQNVLEWISGLNGKMAQVQTDLNAGIAAAQPALQTALALGSSLNTAYKLYASTAPALGLPAPSVDDMANEAVAMAGLNALANAPPASNTATAAAAAMSATLQIKAALAKVDPAAANAGVPAPPSTPVAAPAPAPTAPAASQ